MDALRIRDLRKGLKLTQEAFAQKLKVSLHSVQRWERARAKPSRMAIEKLIAAEGDIRE